MWKVRRGQSLASDSCEMYVRAPAPMRDRLDFPTIMRFSPCPAPRSHKRGRGSAALLFILAALAVGVFFVLPNGDEGGPSMSGKPGEGLRPELGEGQGADPASHTGPLWQGNSEKTDPTGVTYDQERSAQAPSRKLPSFDGRGSIRGLVGVVGGRPLPVAFKVHVGPSTSLQGRERAEARSVDIEGSGEFAISDLPMGGYDVWVVAPNMNTVRTPVLLSESSADPYVTLLISPTGYLDGFVVCTDGRPARELRVALEARFGEGRLETTTRADGFYRFGSVPDGEFRILFGPLNAPLLPARDLVFSAPSMRFPRTELPPTADVLFHTTDTSGRALGGVTLTGFGKPAGRIELVSDSDGLAWGHNLQPGRYRLAARNGEGLRSSNTIQIELGPGQEYWINVR
jgi:hypothetical protein